MEVNIHHAKANLSKLIAAARAGKRSSSRNGTPAVKIVKFTPTIRTSRKHMLGSGGGKIWMADDDFSPATDQAIWS